MKIRFIKEYVSVDPATNSGIIHRFGETEEIENYTAEWLIDSGFAEEVKESGRWKPKFDEKYYFLGNTGKVCVEPWLNDELDEYRYSMGECFKTEKAAEAWRGYRIARATVSRDEGVLTPEQAAKSISTHYISFDTESQLGVWQFNITVNCIPANAILFGTAGNARASLNNHPDEWKIIASYDWSRE